MSEYLRYFKIKTDTKINQDLDPFSEEYINSQIAFYEEISNRKLDQSKGEQCSFQLSEHLHSPNPYNLVDPTFITKHARCILMCILPANLKGNAGIFNMGAGRRLSTEMSGLMA